MHKISQLSQFYKQGDQRLRFKLGHLAPIKPRRFKFETGILTISFDDFPRSAVTEAGPILDQHDVKATYFASGGLCETTYLGQEQFTRRDLEDIADKGHDIGSHTFDHMNALEHSNAAFVSSIKKNSDFLQDVIPGKSIESFAYPFGTVTFSSKLTVSSEFKIGRGLGQRPNYRWIDLSQVKAVGFEKRQRQKYNFQSLIKDTSIKKGWLIVYTHDVRSNPSNWGCTPEELDNLISYAKGYNLNILTFREAAAKMRI